ALAGRPPPGRPSEHPGGRGRPAQTARCCRRPRPGPPCCWHPDRRRCVAGVGCGGGGGGASPGVGWDGRLRARATRRRPATSARTRPPEACGGGGTLVGVPFRGVSVLLRTTKPAPSIPCVRSFTLPLRRLPGNRRIS